VAGLLWRSFGEDQTSATGRRRAARGYSRSPGGIRRGARVWRRMQCRSGRARSAPSAKSAHQTTERVGVNITDSSRQNVSRRQPQRQCGLPFPPCESLSCRMASGLIPQPLSRTNTCVTSPTYWTSTSALLLWIDATPSMHLRNCVKCSSNLQPIHQTSKGIRVKVKNGSCASGAADRPFCSREHSQNVLALYFFE